MYFTKHPLTEPPSQNVPPHKKYPFTKYPITKSTPQIKYPSQKHTSQNTPSQKVPLTKAHLTKHPLTKVHPSQSPLSPPGGPAKAHCPLPQLHSEEGSQSPLFTCRGGKPHPPATPTDHTPSPTAGGCRECETLAVETEAITFAPRRGEGSE